MFPILPAPSRRHRARVRLTEPPMWVWRLACGCPVMAIQVTPGHTPASAWRAVAVRFDPDALIATPPPGLSVEVVSGVRYRTRVAPTLSDPCPHGADL